MRWGTMTGSITATLAGALTSVIAASGYGGVIFLMALELACLPLPSEVIMPFAGYLVSIGHMNLWLVATAGAIGCNVGSTAAYYAGAWGGRPMVLRWGHYVLLDEDALERTERFFNRFGNATVFIGRLLPGVRSFVSLPAGMARMSIWKFELYSFVGSWPWCLLLAWVGYRLGKAWDKSPALRQAMHALDGVVAVALLIGIVWFVRKHIKRRRHGD